MVKTIGYQVPLATGVRCEHDRDVAYNLSVHGRHWPDLLGVVFHLDDDSECDGQLVVHGRTGWR